MINPDGHRVRPGLSLAADIEDEGRVTIGVAADALARERSRMVASREGGAVRVAKNIPAEPPPELAAAPELFMELPILRNLEKLEHFEAIRTTTLDDGGAQSNG